MLTERECQNLLHKLARLEASSYRSRCRCHRQFAKRQNEVLKAVNQYFAMATHQMDRDYHNLAEELRQLQSHVKNQMQADPNFQTVTDQDAIAFDDDQ